jgi:hypothetical protein
MLHRSSISVTFDAIVYSHAAVGNKRHYATNPEQATHAGYIA